MLAGVGPFLTQLMLESMFCVLSVAQVQQLNLWQVYWQADEVSLSRALGPELRMCKRALSPTYSPTCTKLNAFATCFQCGLHSWILVSCDAAP